MVSIGFLINLKMFFLLQILWEGVWIDVYVEFFWRSHWDIVHVLPKLTHVINIILWVSKTIFKIFDQLVTIAYHSFPLWRYLHYSENMRVLAANNRRLHDIYLYPVHHHTDRKSNSQPLIVVIGTNSIGRYKSTTCSHPRWPLQKIKLNIF